MSLHFAYRSVALATTIFALSACNTSTDNTAPPPATAASTPSAQSAAVPALQTVTASTLPTSTVETAKQGAYCALDAIDGAGNLRPTDPTIMKAGQVFTAGGWVVDSKVHSAAKFTLVLQGPETYGFDGAAGVARPDVAKALNNDAASQSGFNISANLGNTPAGTYKILALIKGQDGNEICDMQHQLTIGG